MNSAIGAIGSIWSQKILKVARIGTAKTMPEIPHIQRQEHRAHEIHGVKHRQDEEAGERDRFNIGRSSQPRCEPTRRRGFFLSARFSTIVESHCS